MPQLNDDRNREHLDTLIALNRNRLTCDDLRYEFGQIPIRTAQLAHFGTEEQQRDIANMIAAQQPWVVKEEVYNLLHSQMPWRTPIVDELLNLVTQHKALSPDEHAELGEYLRTAGLKLGYDAYWHIRSFQNSKRRPMLTEASTEPYMVTIVVDEKYL